MDNILLMLTKSVQTVVLAYLLIGAYFLFAGYL